MSKLHIVQTWKTSSLPGALSGCAHSWQAQHPAADYWLATDEDLWGWLEERRELFPHAIQADRPPIRTIDMFRYCYLLMTGGLYADVDFYCLRSMSTLLAAHPDAVVLGSVRLPPTRVYHSVPNAFMYCERPGHPFWLVVLELARQRCADEFVEWATGPALLYCALEIYRGFPSGTALAEWNEIGRLAAVAGVSIPESLPPVTVLPPDDLYPLSWMLPEDQELLETCRTAPEVPQLVIDRLRARGSFAFTFWNYSWADQRKPQAAS